jgi:hypothetical protein
MSVWREAAFSAFPHFCDECGFVGDGDNPLHVHHKDRDRKNNDVSNLRIMCRSCHFSLHANENQAKERARMDAWFETEDRKQTERWNNAPKLSVSFQIEESLAEELFSMSFRDGIDRFISGLIKARFDEWARMESVHNQEAVAA